MSVSSTVIVALIFNDGAVIGADSQASDFPSGVRWPVNKLSRIGNAPLVLGFSGQTAPAEQLRTTLHNAFQSPGSTFDRPDRVRKRIEQSVRPTYQDISSHHPDATWGSVWKVTAVGLAICWAEDAPHILEIEANGVCDFHDYFHAIGSGASVARAIWRTMGAERLRSMDGGLALEVIKRILTSCIETELMGVSNPIRMWVVDTNGVRQLSSMELDTLEMSDADFWSEIGRLV